VPTTASRKGSKVLAKKSSINKGAKPAPRSGAVKKQNTNVGAKAKSQTNSQVQSNAKVAAKNNASPR
jgi:hypothetical protein